MAKVTGPLLSLKAQGTLGKTLTYFAHKGQQRIRKYLKHKITHTTAQLRIRNLNKSAVVEWKNIDSAEQIRFRQAVWTPHFHGYHYFMSEYITRTLQEKILFFEAPAKLVLNWTVGTRRLW